MLLLLLASRLNVASFSVAADVTSDVNGVHVVTSIPALVDVPADAGSPFDAEGFDAAHVPPYNHSC